MALEDCDHLLLYISGISGEPPGLYWRCRDCLVYWPMDSGQTEETPDENVVDLQ